MKKTIMFFTGVALCKVFLPGGESFAGESSNRTELKAAVQERVLEANLQVEGFRHGDETHSGGYTIAPGQLLDDAMADYEAQIPQITDQHLANVTRMLHSVSDPELRVSLQQSRREFLRQKKALQKQGLQVIGLDLRGNGRALEHFKQTDSSVRVMELRSENRRNAAILPAD